MPVAIESPSDVFLTPHGLLRLEPTDPPSPWKDAGVAQRVAEDLMDNGKVSRPMVGVAIDPDFTAAEAAAPGSVALAADAFAPGAGAASAAAF